MASICISNCINDAKVPMRATYRNLYKWPESDAEFVRSVSSNVNTIATTATTNNSYSSRVADGISCRQLYLRSYTFSRKESVPDKTKKCFGKVKESVSKRRMRKSRDGSSRKRRCLVMEKVKDMSCNALFSLFNRLLFCSSTVDVVEH